MYMPNKYDQQHVKNILLFDLVACTNTRTRAYNNNLTKSQLQIQWQQKTQLYE